MTQTIKQVLLECVRASGEGRIHFGQVVEMLMEAGVESYHVDYREGRMTYYLASGDVFAIDVPQNDVRIAEAFDAAGLREAIRGAQQGTVMYPEFKRLSQIAGCASYTVWISGRHVTYFGRKGEMHVERFPS